MLCRILEYFAGYDKAKSERRIPYAAAKAASYLEECKAMQNSAGGIIECVITGVPAGIGDPVFEKIDANLAKAIFSIGAVKGFEIGDGFAVAAATGLTNNDAFVTDALVLAAKAFIILHRAKDLGTEKTVAFRLLGTIVNRLRLLDFTVGPGVDLFGTGKSDADRVEMIFRLDLVEDIVKRHSHRLISP